ncbi:autophagy protein atg9 [Rhodotorula kratochvilovae]
MPLSQRFGDALSIFLPANSVYADLDDPPDELQEPPVPPPLHHPTRGPHAHFDPNTPQDGLRPADDDPFAPVSPSVLSHASARSPSRPPAPPHSSSPLDPHAGAQHQAGAPFAREDDIRDPFQPDPIPASPPQSRSRSLSPTPTSSIAHAVPRSPQAGRSPPSSIASSSKGRLGASRSGIGSRSLMGLMGGTRYEGQGFPFGGVGVGEEDEEEEEEGTVERDERPRVRSRDDLQTIAASLPPPPSALSASSHDETEEEEDDADGPPDFTARIPLVSSTHPGRRAHRAAHAPHAHSSEAGSSRRRGPTGGIINGRRWAAGMNAKERALWRWVNVGDLDGFLQQVYLYYVGKGIWAIGLERTLNLLTVGWVIGFSTFLIGCIDYPRLWHSNHLSDVVIPRCTSRLSGFTLLLFIAFVAFYAWRVVRFGMGVRRLWDMHEFYTELLEVPESDIQTIPWHAIVARLSDLRANHPSALSSRSANGQPTERLDAHDVANRIMRQENYLIALFNKGLLDISLPLPRPLRSTVGRVLGKSRFGKSMLTQTLEWNLSFCVLGFLFGTDGQVRRAFLSDRNKGELVEALRRRFILMGLINAVFAPFIVLYLLTYSFFRYFEEYHKNPSSIGSRQFTPLARWKFREFNELPHHFQQRLALAHPLADQYINHYPKAKTVLLSRFVAFLAGSFAAVLILFSLIDPDAFLHFEITPGRTVLFYIGVFGTVLAVARGMVPDENRVVDPEELMRGIVEHTHYLPAEWKDKLHSSQVHLAFGKLFQMKVVLFVQEILSVLITPFVLWYTLPDCAGPVVDFFREFTVHVDGLGYVCSFAVFDFKRHGDTKFGAPVQETRDERWKSSQGKMEKSFLTFAASNPAWVPRDQTQSLFLSKMTEAAPPPHLSQLHPSSSTYAPHSRHPSAASIRARHRFAPGLALAEEPPSSSAQLRAEKARMYDRAFAQSALLAASASGVAGSGAGRAPGPSRRGRAPAALAAGTGVIDEESALDGEGFVAPTETQPFGLPASEDEDDAAELGEPGAEVERMRRRGLGGLMSEMMYR